MTLFKAKTLLLMVPIFCLGLFPINALDLVCSLPDFDKCSDEGFFARVSPLFWTVEQSDLDYAVDKNFGGVPLAIGPGRYHYLDYDWDMGFRIEGGYWFDCGNWDLRVVYTHFRTTASDKVREQSKEESLQSTISFGKLFGFGKAVERAEGSLQLDYDVVDLVLRKHFYFSQNFNLSPFFGLRALWLDQRANFEYKLQFVGLEDPDTDIVKFRSLSEVMGLFLGFDTHYCICEGWGLYGNFAISFMQGDYTDEEKFWEFTKGNVTFEPVNLKSRYQDPLLGYQLGFGLGYARQVFDCWTLHFQLVYEMALWHNISSIRRWNGATFIQESNLGGQGKLLLHGFSINTGVYF